MHLAKGKQTIDIPEIIFGPEIKFTCAPWDT